MSTTEFSSTIVNGLTGQGADFVFATIVLVGIYFLINNNLGKFINRFITQNDSFIGDIKEGISKIGSELRLGREAIMEVKSSQDSLEKRVMSLEEKIEKK